MYYRSAGILTQAFVRATYSIDIDMSWAIQAPSSSSDNRVVPVPPWWPYSGQGRTKAPLTYVYRAMSVDHFSEFEDQPSEWRRTVRSMDADSVEFRLIVIDCLANASHWANLYGEGSPFFHTSKSLTGCRRWHAHGREVRHELPRDQIVVRINIWDWYQSMVAAGNTEQLVIDVSNDHLQGEFFFCQGKNVGDHDFFGVMGEYVKASRQAETAKEVLLKWRGTIPIRFFEVLDNRDELLCPLEEIHAKLLKEKGQAHSQVIPREMPSVAKADVPVKAPRRDVPVKAPHPDVHAKAGQEVYRAKAARPPPDGPILSRDSSVPAKRPPPPPPAYPPPADSNSSASRPKEQSAGGQQYASPTPYLMKAPPLPQQPSSLGTLGYISISSINTPVPAPASPIRVQLPDPMPFSSSCAKTALQYMPSSAKTALQWRCSCSSTSSNTSSSTSSTCFHEEDGRR